MILETLKDSKESVSIKLAEALKALNSINFFAALCEIALTRWPEHPQKPRNTEESALINSRREGYMDAIQDIFYFRDRFLVQDQQVTVPRDFGAARYLVERGEMTKAQYKEWTGLNYE